MSSSRQPLANLSPLANAWREVKIDQTSRQIGVILANGERSVSVGSNAFQFRFKIALATVARGWRDSQGYERFSK